MDEQRNAEFQLLVLRGLNLLVSRLGYTGVREIEVKRDTFYRDCLDFVEHWHPESKAPLPPLHYSGPAQK